MNKLMRVENIFYHFKISGTRIHNFSNIYTKENPKFLVNSKAKENIKIQPYCEYQSLTNFLARGISLKLVYIERYRFRFGECFSF